ncbi:hypothetical protein FNF27_03743 [Cafeteria roenbergensis]|uniref:Uncharacterized protein n=1 Tax=Cafeteria roenbergensis TaxID=33653 RepID=A0A5A8EC39_CAFRO|nr:hypothetical protein FNF27_03743 [Cafeteria roenbergensis]
MLAPIIVARRAIAAAAGAIVDTRQMLLAADLDAVVRAVETWDPKVFHYVGDCRNAAPEAMDRFVGGFYKSVGLGAEVEVAFAEGCNAVLAAGFKLGPPEAGEKHGGVPCLLVDVETPALKRARAALPDVVIEVMPPLKLDFSAFTSASSYATAEEGPGLPTTQRARWTGRIGLKSPFRAVLEQGGAPSGV